MKRTLSVDNDILKRRTMRSLERLGLRTTYSATCECGFQSDLYEDQFKAERIGRAHWIVEHDAELISG